MNPTDANSHLATLRQLKEMLDAGTLTPQEFEALKQKLVFGKDATAAAAEVAPAFIAPVSIAEALTSASALPGEAPLPPSPTQTPTWPSVAALVEEQNTLTSPAEDDYAEAGDPPRNPLNLVFAIGGALVFLAVILYLTLGNRGTDEHLTSTTQTAADSTAVAPEIGPQAQQLTLPPATPETVRVAPVIQVPVAPAAAKFRADSTAAAVPAVPLAKPAAKPTPAPTTTVATDTTI